MLARLRRITCLSSAWLILVRIIINLHFSKPENKTDFKYGDQLASDDSILRETSLEERNTEEPLKNQSNLPLKKIFGDTTGNLNLTKHHVNIAIIGYKFSKKKKRF